MQETHVKTTPIYISFNRVHAFDVVISSFLQYMCPCRQFFFFLFLCLFSLFFNRAFFFYLFIYYFLYVVGLLCWNLTREQESARQKIIQLFIHAYTSKHNFFSPFSQFKTWYAIVMSFVSLQMYIHIFLHIGTYINIVQQLRFDE